MLAAALVATLIERVDLVVDSDKTGLWGQKKQYAGRIEEQNFRGWFC
jgi:hypothetical protein